MKTGLSFVAFGVLLVLPLAATGQPTAFTYQGELRSGDAPADGSFDLRFGLFPAAAGGAQIGGDQIRSAVAVAAGVFTVQLDFGVSAFPGASRFLEIAVRPAGSGGFTTLTPRQQISSAPYAIRTLGAATADSLSSACVGCVSDTHIQSISGSKVNGAIPASSVPAGSGSYIQNGTTPQTNARFNIAGNGTVGGVLSAATAAVGGAALPNGVALAVNGPARVSPGGSGGYVQLGSPSGESGVSIIGANNRTDLRFNDSTVKLVAGPGTGPPNQTSGVSINTAGQVGIGVDGALDGKLHVYSDTQPAVRAISYANRAIWGSAQGSSRGVFGDSYSGEGVHGESLSGTGVAGITGAGAADTAGVYGASSNPTGVGTRGDGATGVYGRSTVGSGIGVRGEATASGGTGVSGSSAAGPGVSGTSSSNTGAGVVAVNSGTGPAIAAQGNAVQSLAAGGWVKAMLYVEGNRTISRCYNSQATGAAVFTPPCGFQVSAGATGGYPITAPFDINNRFISATPANSGLAQTNLNISINAPRVFYVTIQTNDDGDSIDASFALFIF
ncbi:hypothetical protein KF840_04230 [bacterium]|nr:hypothetical protein [bacterium]